MLTLKQLVRASVDRKYDLAQDLRFSNPFHVEHFRGGKLLGVSGGFNGVTIEGKNLLLNVMFHGTTALSPWYIGLINNTPTPTLAEADTLASHAGWTEFTAYTGNRQEWTETEAANKVIGTDTVSSFPITATTATVNGILIASAASGTSGTLWATGSFTTPRDVISGDILRVTYGVRC